MQWLTSQTFANVAFIMSIRQITFRGLEDYNAPVFLRPRRFGKSLLISMLASYYDRTKAPRFEELFGGTWVGTHPTQEHNQYLVIRYDFSKMVMANDMQGLARNFDALNCSL